jgi:hypothetical protein
MSVRASCFRLVGADRRSRSIVRLAAPIERDRHAPNFIPACASVNLVAKSVYVLKGAVRTAWLIAPSDTVYQISDQRQQRVSTRAVSLFDVRSRSVPAHIVPSDETSNCGCAKESLMVRREGLQCHTGVPIHRWRLPGAHAAPRRLPKFRRVAVTYCALGDGVRQPRQMEGRSS